jgi:hypothetical protein
MKSESIISRIRPPSVGPCFTAPTTQGRCTTVYDALCVTEFCLEGLGKHAPRQIHSYEREHLIKDGNIFVYEKHSSGIDLWNDGREWMDASASGGSHVFWETEEEGKVPTRKQDALIKRVFDISYNGMVHHVVSYDAADSKRPDSTLRKEPWESYIPRAELAVVSTTNPYSTTGPSLPTLAKL